MSTVPTKVTIKITYSVTAAGCVQVVSEGTPGDGIRVVRLDLLSRPDVGTLDIEKNRTLRRDNDFHNDIVQQTALEHKLISSNRV